MLNQRTATPQSPQSFHQSQTNSPSQIAYANQQQQSPVSNSSNQYGREPIPKRVCELKREGVLRRTPKENWKWAVKKITADAKNVSRNFFSDKQTLAP